MATETETETETDQPVMTKEEIGRKYIAQFLDAMNYHDPDLQNTIKIMRNKLLQIQQDESLLLKKPIRKITFKFRGSEPVILQKRTHSQTLVSVDNNNNDDDAAEQDCKRQKKMVVKNDNVNNGTCTHSAPPNPNPSEPTKETVDFIKSVGGSGVELVIEKRLTVSDVTWNQGRLLIPVLQVKNPGFMTEDEKVILGNKQNISVLVLDPERRKVGLNLSKWKMSKEYYVLKTKWNQIVCTNGLKENMVIRVLSFRDVHHKLCFAIDRLA